VLLFGDGGKAKSGVISYTMQRGGCRLLLKGVALDASLGKTWIGPPRSATNGTLSPVSIALPPTIEVQKSGLLFSSNPSLDAWEAIGRQLLAISDSVTWWIADWLAFGEATFKDRYVEAIRKTNLSYQTLRNYVWVARRFELHRRRDNLSFGHHAEVAALDCPEQDYWLRKAEEYRWSRNQLRNEVRSSLRERKNTDAHEETSEVFQLRLTSEQMTLFKSAAGFLSCSLDEWVIHTLEAAARRRIGQ
jgi:hypothetical protein